MYSTHDLLGSLPIRLCYMNVVYTLIYNLNQVKGCVQLQYLDKDNNLLVVEGTPFFIIAERHYATHFMTVIILNNCKQVLSYLAYDDISDFKITYQALLQNEQSILNEINKYNINSEYVTLDKLDMVNTNGDYI